MSRPRQIRIGREGLYYAILLLGVLVGAVSRQLNLLMLLGSILAGPLLFSLIYGRIMLGRLVVERKLPPELRANQRLVVDVSVSNPRRRLGAWAVAVEDSVEREGGTHAPGDKVGVGVFFPNIAAGETGRVSYDGRLPRRGRYRFGPLRVSSRFPLGLVRHSFLVEQYDVLLVHPRSGQLTHDWAKVMRENAAGRQPTQRRGLLEADYFGLRDWRTGDSRHWIHWRTSARRGSLVVRQFEQRRSEDLALLVDLWQPADPTESQQNHVETAITFVATVIAQACRRPGHNLILSVAAQEPLYRPGPASPLYFREQMDALAVAAPHGDAEFPRALVETLTRIPPSMPTLIVSTRSIDPQALRAAAAGRDVRATGRPLQSVNVAGDELNRYFRG